MAAHGAGLQVQAADDVRPVVRGRQQARAARRERQRRRRRRPPDSRGRRAPSRRPARRGGRGRPPRPRRPASAAVAKPASSPVSAAASDDQRLAPVGGQGGTRRHRARVPSRTRWYPAAVARSRSSAKKRTGGRRANYAPAATEVGVRKFLPIGWANWLGFVMFALHHGRPLRRDDQRDHRGPRQRQHRGGDHDHRLRGHDLPVRHHQGEGRLGDRADAGLLAGRHARLRPLAGASGRPAHRLRRGRRRKGQHHRAEGSLVRCSFRRPFPAQPVPPVHIRPRPGA